MSERLGYYIKRYWQPAVPILFALVIAIHIIISFTLSLI